MSIEVHVAGLGRVVGDSAERNETQAAVCSLCGEESDAVASVTAEPAGVFACKSCLRGRLEAMTLGAWMLRPDGPLPWGKVTS